MAQRLVPVSWLSKAPGSKPYDVTFLLCDFFLKSKSKSIMEQKTKWKEDEETTGRVTNLLTYSPKSPMRDSLCCSKRSWRGQLSLYHFLVRSLDLQWFPATNLRWRRVLKRMSWQWIQWTGNRIQLQLSLHHFKEFGSPIDNFLVRSWFSSWTFTTFVAHFLARSLALQVNIFSRKLKLSKSN